MFSLIGSLLLILYQTCANLEVINYSNVFIQKVQVLFLLTTAISSKKPCGSHVILHLTIKPWCGHTAVHLFSNGVGLWSLNPKHVPAIWSLKTGLLGLKNCLLPKEISKRGANHSKKISYTFRENPIDLTENPRNPFVLGKIS